jgi:hypothetical protein
MDNQLIAAPKIRAIEFAAMVPSDVASTSFIIGFVLFINQKYSFVFFCLFNSGPTSSAVLL